MGSRTENLSQHLGLLQVGAHRESCDSGLQLEMLEGHFACETQDNRQKERLERMEDCSWQMPNPRTF